MGADAGPGGRVLAGRYALVDVLGRGGMGVVWLADDRLLERQVAVKELTFSFALTEEERQVLRERSLREARAAARLHHPCVTTVFDVVEEGGKPWLVMERVTARSLHDLVTTSGPLPPDAVARIGLDVLAALEAAHTAGIVHRDVKPANVLVDDDGHARLTDFGIATTAGDPALTGGALIGSPPYMAPERATGEDSGPAADLWSLGATLYCAVEGHPPFERAESMATLMAVVTEDPPEPARAGPLTPALMGLLEKDPDRRSTPARARADLEAALAGGPEPAPEQAPQQAAQQAPRPAEPQPAPQQPPQPAPQPAEPRPAARSGRGSVAVLSADDLRALASASRAVLHAVRDARTTAREQPGAPARAGRPEPAAPRGAFGRRVKRRLVKIALTVVLVVVLLVTAAVLLVLHLAGAF
jgi:eukaryotic-like serine/threonine-protein kinase